MEVVEEINRIRDDRLAFEEHRKALLHQCLEKHLCDNRVCTGKGIFTTDSKNLFWSERQHHLYGRQYGCSRGKPVRAPSKVLKCLSYANQMQTALLRAITNEKGLINKSFKIYSFTFSFR